MSPNFGGSFQSIEACDKFRVILSDLFLILLFTLVRMVVISSVFFVVSSMALFADVCPSIILTLICIVGGEIRLTFGTFTHTKMWHNAAYIYCSEVLMDDFFPFVHKREKKKEFEPEPLYIELYPPPPKRDEEEKEDSNPTVIIIQL
jgi:hypothetical protein